MRPTVILLAIAALVFVPSSALATGCDVVVAPTGNDSAAGSWESPLATPAGMLRRLSSGQTGCFRAGSYRQEDIRVEQPDLTITAVDGEQVTLRGRLRVMPGADRLIIRGLLLDGRNAGNLPSPTVLANDVSLIGNEITNYDTAICVNAGATTWADIPITGPIIRANRIHNCGRRPETNHDHGIYLEATVGAQVTDNVIYDNADRGVQMYPHARDSLVSHNIIDGNGQGIIFSGAGGLASNGNLVEHNVISHSRLRAAIESWWEPGTLPGLNNVARDNCVSGTVAVDLSGGGFAALNNLTADPHYVDRDSHDFRLAPGSPCAALFAADGPTPSISPVVIALPRFSGVRGRRAGAQVRLSGALSASCGQLTWRAGSARWAPLHASCGAGRFVAAVRLPRAVSKLQLRTVSADGRVIQMTVPVSR